MRTKYKYTLLFLHFLLGICSMQAQSQHWQYDTYAWEYDMTAFFVLNLNNQTLNNLDDYEIAAFCGKECRGVAKIHTTEKDGQTISFGYLRIRSNQQSGDTITFKAYDRTLDKEYDVEDYFLIFHSQEVIGLPSAPILFSLLDDYKILVTSADETKGSVTGSGTVKFGNEVTVTALANEGYHFVNWTIDGNVVSEEPIYTFTANENKSLLANFSPNQYTMTFLLDNGEENIVKTQDYGDELVVPADPIKAGFTFTGWSPSVPATVPASDKIFTAQWERNSYKLTWVVDGEKTESMVLYETPIKKPSDPEKTGYTFDGWVPEVETTMPDHDVTYTAVYVANQYTISFDTDGGSEIEPITQDYNTDVTPPAEPTKVGHTFAGWDREIPTNMPAEDVTIKAVWTVKQYTISFDTDGGSEIDPITQDYNTAVTPPAEPTKVGHTFAGWDREMPQTMPAEDITIKALWTVNKYTVSFDTDGGSEIDPITQDYNTAVTKPAEPTKVGHTFAGWDREMPQTMPAEDITIKALWTVNKYTISFDTDGGSEIAPITQDYNTAVTPPAEPTKVGHTFAGWDREIPTNMPAEDVTIKAVWTVNMYKVSFVADGTVISEETLAYGSQITPPSAPEKEGYTFAGWKDVPEAMPANDIEIYGTYTVNAYKLTYKVDGTVYKEYTIEYGTEIVPEAIPEKEGHTFSGWEGLPDVMPAHDVVASGTFSINSFNAVFIVGEDVIETRTIVYGNPVTPPEAPEKEGHTFAGWKDVPETMPAHDIEIYGTYTVNAYKLTVFLDGSIYMEDMLEYGTPIVIPDPEVPDGMKFDGWTTDVPETMPAYDLEIYGTTSVHTGIRGIIDDEQAECSIYDIKGNLLFKNVSSKGISNRLSKGLYIINGKKILIH